MTTAIKNITLPGSISYDGFEFGSSGSTPPVYALTGTPVYDEAGRTVTHVRYLLELSTVLYAGEESIAAISMTAVRHILSRPGKKLELQELGLGDTEIARDGTHSDLAWGAQPRVLRLEPVGGALAWQLHWQCEFNISEPSSSADRQRWMSLNVRVEHELDELGFTTRTIGGHVEVAADAGAQGRPRTTADRVRDRLRFRVPSGFKRLRSRYRQSADARRLEFTVIDEELRDDPFPAGITAGDIDYELTQTALDAGKPAARISGWLESAPGYAKSLAATRLLAIVQDKLRRLNTSLIVTGGIAVPARIVLRHKLFTRRTWLTADIHVSQGAGDWLAASGMWEPVAGSNQRAWRASVESLWSARGQAGLKVDPSDNAIVDLVDRPTEQRSLGAGGESPAETPPNNPPFAGLLPTIPAGASWLAYETAIRTVRQENVSEHLLSKQISLAATGSEYPGLGPPFSADDSPGSSAGASPGVVQQIHGEPRQRIILTGRAVRLGELPAAPALQSFGGRAVRELRREEHRRQLGQLASRPAHELTWSITYAVDGYVGRAAA